MQYSPSSFAWLKIEFELSVSFSSRTPTLRVKLPSVFGTKSYISKRRVYAVFVYPVSTTHYPACAYRLNFVALSSGSKGFEKLHLKPLAPPSYCPICNWLPHIVHYLLLDSAPFVGMSCSLVDTVLLLSVDTLLCLVEPTASAAVWWWIYVTTLMCHHCHLLQAPQWAWEIPISRTELQLTKLVVKRELYPLKGACTR